MFDSPFLYRYLAAFAAIGIASYLSTRIKKKMDPMETEHDLIRAYLLNESPLYGMNRPKLWVHTEYRVNSREWTDPNKTNTTDLNQPYLHLTIQTIIDHCGDDFNVCLLDDDSFARLLPDWDVDMNALSDPYKRQFRALGLAKILYLYGGVLVPNSFICMRNLVDLYKESLDYSTPVLFENVNRAVLNHCQGSATGGVCPEFAPWTGFMACKKSDPQMHRLVEFLKGQCRANGHGNEASEFKGDVATWLQGEVREHRMRLVNGKLIGVRAKHSGKAILIDDLFSEDYVDVDINAVFGVYVPADEVLKRAKFEWFVYLPIEQVLNQNLMVSKFLKASIATTISEYGKNHETKSVIGL